VYSSETVREEKVSESDRLRGLAISDMLSGGMCATFVC
jgi:hypothetical protein